MLKHNTTKSLNRTLFELEKLYFQTNNTYSTSHHRERWLDYSEIINHFIMTGNKNYIFELYYKVLDGENINSVLMELIHRDNEVYLTLYPFNHILEEYKDFDDVRIFF